MLQLFKLVPLFLAVSLPTEEKVWRYGPEYTYDVNIRVVSSNLNATDVYLDYHIYSTLKCLPTENGLLCRIGDLIKSEWESTFTMSISQHDVWSDQTFEILFNADGISSLTVHPTLQHHHINMIRAIVSQFSIGFEIGTKDVFQTKESSYIGQCETLVRIYQTDDKPVEQKNDFQIVTIPKLLHDQTYNKVVIDKARDMRNCVQRAHYLFSRVRERKNFEDIKLVGSDSRMTITNTSFESYTENTIYRTIRWGRQTINEKINLKLVSVLPAKEEPQRPANLTAVTSLYVLNETGRIWPLMMEE